jgi:hypothetical protein
MNAEWMDVATSAAIAVGNLVAGWFAHAVWDQPRRNATERALESARLELKALTAHTMARHKARSDAALRGHATRRAASAVAAAQPTMDNCAAYMQPRPPVVSPEVQP